MSSTTCDQKQVNEVLYQGLKTELGGIKVLEQQKDHYRYHMTGWTCHLWIKAFGFPALLRRLEKMKHLETAIGTSKMDRMVRFGNLADNASAPGIRTVDGKKYGGRFGVSICG